MTLEPFVLTDYYDGERATDEYRSVHRQIQAGFYGEFAAEEVVDVRARINHDQGMAFRGFLDDEPTPVPGLSGSEYRPVATLGAFPGQINVGAAVLPARMITAVGVAPTHRRRGLLRQMITGELTAAQQSDCPLAVLTSSEGGIYQRFGFGIATRTVSHTVDLGSRPQIRPEVLRHTGAEAGRVYEVDPVDMLEASSQINKARLADWPGQPLRPTGQHEKALGMIDLANSSTARLRNLKGYLYWGSSGPEALAVIRHEGWDSPEPATVKVIDLQYATVAGFIGIWNQLLTLDLVDQVRFADSENELLLTALINPRSVRQLETGDMLWTRILDVPAVLKAREYAVDGALTVNVSDPTGLAGGRYHLTVLSGRARVNHLPESSNDEAVYASADEVAVDISDLATAVFRGASTLTELRLITGNNTELFARMFAVSQQPYSDFGF